MWIRWPGHESNHLPPSVQIINECSDTQLLLNDFMMCIAKNYLLNFNLLQSKISYDKEIL